MSHLVLIRHGQASFMDGDYDKLSPLGEEQSRQLGKLWIEREVKFDAVYSGTLVRQRSTAEVIGNMFAEVGIHWPESVEMQGLKEYDADGMMEILLPRLSDKDTKVRSLVANFKQASSRSDRYRHFHRMLEAVARYWMLQTVETPGVEGWRTFHDRVRAALERIQELNDGGRRIAVFTSGGPISVAIQLATQAPEATALELNWRIRNCSISEIVYSRNRSTLDSFNTIPHLQDPALWSYR